MAIYFKISERPGKVKIYFEYPSTIANNREELVKNILTDLNLTEIVNTLNQPKEDIKQLIRSTIQEELSKLAATKPSPAVKNKE